MDFNNYPNNSGADENNSANERSFDENSKNEFENTSEENNSFDTVEVTEEKSFEQPVHVSSDTNYTNGYNSSGNYYDNVSPNSGSNHTVLKPVLISVLINAVVTVLICSVIIGGFTLFNRIKIGKNSTDSMIVFRDGDDLRQKVDVNDALASMASDGETPLTTQEIARKVGPSVVGIVSTGEASNGFFTQNYESSGSGIIISEDGYIVTNNHVVENAKQIKVILNTNDEYAATLIGTDPKTDLAVLKIEASGLTWATLGNSSSVEVGEPVVAIGNPLGMELAGTVTKGIISATNRTIEVEGKTFTLLQTDAAINSGNSGGALVNCYGEVIGINSAKLAASGVEGLSFSIPSDVAKPIIEDLIDVGYVQGRPSIGIIGQNITESMSKAYNLDVGILVINVVNDSAAKQAGIQRGDIITECQGEKVKTIEELNAVRDKYKAGDEITLKIIRDDETLDVKVKLGEESSKQQ